MINEDNLLKARTRIENYKETVGLLKKSDNPIDRAYLLKIKLNLSEIGLTNEEFAKILPEILRFENLYELNLTNNKLTELPKEIERFGKLSSLNLDSNEFTIVPSHIFSIRGLLHLNLRNNNINKLPFIVRRPEILFGLHLDNNKFKVFPEEIGQLKSLWFLTLDNNQLTEVNPNIEQLNRLIQLSLNNNKFKVFPKVIGQLTSLQKLHFNDNLLMELPQQEILRLVNLKVLSFKNNRLISLPQGIKQLPNLYDISKKQLEDYSEQFIAGEGLQEYIKTNNELNLSQNENSSKNELFPFDELVEDNKNKLTALTTVVKHHYDLDLRPRESDVAANQKLNRHRVTRISSKVRR